MSKRSKINVKLSLAIVTAISFVTISVQLTAKVKAFRSNFLLNISQKDTVPTKPNFNKSVAPLTNIRSANKLVNDTAGKNVPDTAIKNKQIQVIDTLTISKDSLDAPIEYAASDSGVLIIPTKEFILYGKANVKNKDVDLEAATIRYDQTGQTVKAYGALDTSGNPSSKPKLTQGEMKTISDSIFFSLKTFKGLTKNTYLQEGEMYINAQVFKKVSATEYFGFRSIFTTCNLDTPHFGIRARKIKVISNKLAISGPASPMFEGVPIPVGIPFGIYPLYNGRHSGILAPAFTVSEDFGFGLEGLGYYKAINDYIDVTVRTNLYSYGGWTLNVSPRYLKRYRHQGSVNLTIQNTKALNRSNFGSFAKEEFNSSRSFMLSWSHSQDQRVRPGTTFSANVNFGSTRYNSTVLNNPFINFQNQLSSSISYSKDFRGKANISLNANHNQNNNTKLVNLNLPTLNANVVTFYPFQKKDQVGTAKWYEKLGIGYSGNFTNQLSFYDSAISIQRLLDTIQWGATHNIPISISLPALGPVTIAPSITYEERWYGQKIQRSWNGKKVDTLITKGFYTSRQMTFGISASTRIFGTYQFKKSRTIQAIRHEIRPSIGVNYKPDLVSKFFYSTQVDTTKRLVRFSQFDGVIPGAYSEGTFGGISFGIDNLLKMKVKNKTPKKKKGEEDAPVDTTKKEEFRKVKLIDGFGFNSSYNLMADSFALAPFQFYARSTLFEKVNITANFTLDPYALDSLGNITKEYTWSKKKFNPGRITGGNIAISTNFQSKTRDGKEADKNIPVDPFLTPEEQQRQLQFARSNPAEFTDFNIPWTLSFSYSLNFSRQLQPDYSFKNIITSSMNFNGDFSLTEKWKMGATGFFDVNAKSLQQLSFFVSREMHCWQLSINVTPVNTYRSFSISISPKSGILRDLRINRNRTFVSQ
ncbi:MAG: putative LPS assembly protein LptD [Chitinophagaceae bacterium]